MRLSPVAPPHVGARGGASLPWGRSSHVGTGATATAVVGTEAAASDSVALLVAGLRSIRRRSPHRETERLLSRSRLHLHQAVTEDVSTEHIDLATLVAEEHLQAPADQVEGLLP